MNKQQKIFLFLTLGILAYTPLNALEKTHFLPNYHEEKMIFSADNSPDAPSDNGGGSINDDTTEAEQLCPPYLLTPEDCREAGQIPDPTAPTCTDSNGIHYTACRCSNEYQECRNNSYGDPSTACTDSEGTKFKNCLCDRQRFPKSEADCRQDMGPNAALFLTLCHETVNGVTTIYGNSCGCNPSCPPSHPYQSCGNKTIISKVSDGCIGSCYKCI